MDRFSDQNLKSLEFGSFKLFCKIEHCKAVTTIYHTLSRPFKFTRYESLENFTMGLNSLFSRDRWNFER